MLEGFKDRVREQKEQRELRKIEKEKAKLERELEIASQERRRIKAEQDRIQAERDRLSQLSEKEIMAEAIMALRGFYSQFEELRIEQEDINDRISELESDIAYLRNQMSSSNDDE